MVRSGHRFCLRQIFLYPSGSLNCGPAPPSGDRACYGRCHNQTAKLDSDKFGNSAEDQTCWLDSIMIFERGLRRHCIHHHFRTTWKCVYVICATLSWLLFVHTEVKKDAEKEREKQFLLQENLAPQLEHLIQRRSGYEYHQLDVDASQHVGNTGLKLVTRQQKVFVADVKEGTIAAHYFKAGDQVLLVTGTPVKGAQSVHSLIMKALWKFQAVVERAVTDEAKNEVFNKEEAARRVDVERKNDGQQRRREAGKKSKLVNQLGQELMHRLKIEKKIRENKTFQTTEVHICAEKEETRNVYHQTPPTPPPSPEYETSQEKEDGASGFSPPVEPE